ncbi:hypothetical protein FRC07_006882, partial [Ceratobasidium sp. 392]
DSTDLSPVRLVRHSPLNLSSNQVDRDSVTISVAYWPYPHTQHPTLRLDLSEEKTSSSNYPSPAFSPLPTEEDRRVQLVELNSQLQTIVLAEYSCIT